MPSSRVGFSIGRIRCAVVAAGLAVVAAAATARAQRTVTSSATGLNGGTVANAPAAEALPIANDRLGVTLFGGVTAKRIEFNEQSLWSGDNNWDDDYQAGDHGFGCYRNFGKSMVEFGKSAGVKGTSPSGDERGDGNGIANAIDGRERTKCSISEPGDRVVWLVELPEPTVVAAYTLTSVNDAPARDPQNWVLAGSNDGRTWTELDQRVLEKPLESRYETNRFTVEKPALYRFYPITFADESDRYFRVAEIALSFVVFLATDDTGDDDRREFDISTRMQRTMFVQNGVTFIREAFARRPDEVMVVRHTARRAGASAPALSGRAGLKSGQPDVAVVVDADGLSCDSLMPNGRKQACRVRVLHIGATAQAGPDAVALDGCNSLPLLVAARTVYAPDEKAGLRGGPPAPLATREIAAAEAKSFTTLKRAHFDDHGNINLQMNYRGVESTALPARHEPLLDFVTGCAEPCRIALRKAFGGSMRGWTACTSQSICGGNGRQWNTPASDWHAQHMAWHYAFTQDREFLRRQAYAIAKEICEFCEGHPKEFPDGTLVAPNGGSPEHRPREDGVMHDHQIVWELFRSYLELAEALGADPDHERKVADMQARLARNKIGRSGQLQKWTADPDAPHDTHRHISHLFAVYPGRQISPPRTPYLARAAGSGFRARRNDHEETTGRQFTVETMSDGPHSGTWPWRCGAWARLGKAERARIMVRGLLTYSTLPNVFCTHPPFQRDGTFSITGTIAEMLLQSHAGEIALVPALPRDWGGACSFSSLRVGGSYRVDCAWKDGRVTSFRIVTDKAFDPTVTVTARVNGEVGDVLPEL